MGFLGVQISGSLSVTVSCDFSWALYPLFVLSISNGFTFVLSFLFYFIIFLLSLRNVFAFQWGRKWVDMYGRGGGRSRWRGKCKQVLYHKISIFSKRLFYMFFIVLHFLEEQVNLLYVLKLCIFLKYSNINWDFKFSFCDNVTHGVYLCVSYTIKIPYILFYTDNWWFWKHLSNNLSVLCNLEWQMCHVYECASECVAAFYIFYY